MQLLGFTPARTSLDRPLWRIARCIPLYPDHMRLPGKIASARDRFAAKANVWKSR